MDAHDGKHERAAMRLWNWDVLNKGRLILTFETASFSWMTEGLCIQAIRQKMTFYDIRPNSHMSCRPWELGAPKVKSPVAKPFETDFLLLCQSGNGALPEVRSLFRNADFQQQGKVV